MQWLRNEVVTISIVTKTLHVKLTLKERDPFIRSGFRQIR